MARNLFHLLVFTLFVQLAPAQSGTLDQTFNGTGIVIDNYDIAPRFIAIQTDNKILTVGGAENVQMIRYNSNGEVDNTFGNSGLVVASHGADYLNPKSMVLLASQKILIGGELNLQASANTKMFVMQFNVDGSIDSSFGTNGMAVCDSIAIPANGCSDPNAANYKDYRYGYLAIQQNGQIVQAGTMQAYCTGGNNTPTVYLTRYSANGAIDPSFNCAVSGLPFYKGTPTSINIQDDSTFLVGIQSLGLGDDSATSVPGFAWFPYNGQASPIQYSFGASVKLDNPQVHSFIGNFMEPHKVGYIVGGYVNDGSKDKFAVMRIDTGIMHSAFFMPRDSSFGNNGLSIIDVGAGGGQANGVVVQPDGKILLVGYSNSNSANRDNYALVRLNANGTPDNTFGINGIVTTDINSNNEEIASCLALQQDGKIVVAGDGYTTSLSNFSGVVRYNNDISLGINSPNENEYSFYVYPNPTKDRLFISGQEENKEVLLFSITGGLVGRYTLAQKEGIDITNLVDGLYIAEIKSKQYSTKVRWLKM